MIIKSPTEIIKEAAALEEFNVSDLITDELRANYSECMKSMTIIPKEVVTYEACMVPVFENTEEYYIEMDNVVKYMNSTGITDIKEAITNIAEANELTLEDVSLVIESRAYMDSILEEAIEMSKNGDKTLLEECELACKLITMLEAEGINVVTIDEGAVDSFKSLINKLSVSQAEKTIERCEKYNKQLEDELEELSKMNAEDALEYVKKRSTVKFLKVLGGATVAGLAGGAIGGSAGAALVLKPYIGLPIIAASMFASYKLGANIGNRMVQKGDGAIGFTVKDYKAAVKNTIKLNKETISECKNKIKDKQ